MFAPARSKLHEVEPKCSHHTMLAGWVHTESTKASSLQGSEEAIVRSDVETCNILVVSSWTAMRIVVQCVLVTGEVLSLGSAEVVPLRNDFPPQPSCLSVDTLQLHRPRYLYRHYDWATNTWSLGSLMSG